MLERDIDSRARELWSQLCRLDGRVGALPTLAFDLRGRSAGQYVWQGSRGRVQFEQVRFNVSFARSQREDFLASTVPHELAHCAAVRLHGHCAHGLPWRVLMQALGADPRRCHSYDTREARGRGHWPARCACRVHDLSSVLRNRLLRGWRYACRRCGAGLRLEEPADDAG